jgi:FkbM family methyltransferase
MRSILQLIWTRCIFSIPRQAIASITDAPMIHIPDSTTTVGKLLRLPLRAVPRERAVPILGGPLRGWQWIPAAASHGCWLGTFERPEQEAFARTVRPGDVVFDLGANAGFYTLLSAKLAGPTGRVVAFEPVPRNLGYLRRHLAINGCENVTVVAAAVADRLGRARFHDGPAHTVGALTDDGEYEVDVTTLDDVAGVAPKVIKIDVEGAEAAVLRGARRVLREARPIVLLSTHSTALREECTALLREARYAIQPMGGDQADLIATPER